MVRYRYLRGIDQQALGSGVANTFTYDEVSNRLDRILTAKLIQRSGVRVFALRRYVLGARWEMVQSDTKIALLRISP